MPTSDKPARKSASAKKSSPTPRRPRSTPAESVDPADVVTDQRYAPTTWGNGQVTGLEDITVPSGQLVQARRPGVQGLMAAGVLHNIDSLTALVDSKHIKRVEGKPDQIQASALLEDTETMANLLHTVDRVVTYIVAQPKIEMAPNDVTLRRTGVIYADSVDLTDKMFLFNYAVGGTRDAESFRRESAEAVGSLRDGSGVELPAE